MSQVKGRCSSAWRALLSAQHLSSSSVCSRGDWMNTCARRGQAVRSSTASAGRLPRGATTSCVKLGASRSTWHTYVQGTGYLQGAYSWRTKRASSGGVRRTSSARNASRTAWQAGTSRAFKARSRRSRSAPCVGQVFASGSSAGEKSSTPLTTAWGARPANSGQWQHMPQAQPGSAKTSN